MFKRGSCLFFSVGPAGTSRVFRLLARVFGLFSLSSLTIELTFLIGVLEGASIALGASFDELEVFEEE